MIQVVLCLEVYLQYIPVLLCLLQLVTETVKVPSACTFERLRLSGDFPYFICLNTLDEYCSSIILCKEPCGVCVLLSAMHS